MPGIFRHTRARAYCARRAYSNIIAHRRRMELIEGPELVDETIEEEGTSSLLTSLRAPKASELARKRKLLHRIVSHATII